MRNDKLLIIAGCMAFARVELDEALIKVDEAEYVTALNCVRAAIACLYSVQTLLERWSISDER